MASPMAHHAMGAKHHMLGRRHHMMGMGKSAMRFGEPVKAAYYRSTSSRMPTPWAVLGMIAAFAGGAFVGMFGGKKYAMNHSGEPMLTGSWWSRKPDDLAAPGAMGEEPTDRYEGE